MRLQCDVHRHSSVMQSSTPIVLPRRWCRRLTRFRQLASRRRLHAARSEAERQAASRTDVAPDSPSTSGREEGSERLFSNLSQQLKHEPGSVFGSSLLVAGTTIGAGILALPEVTQEAGFIPSSAAMLGCWAFSVAVGLAIAEVNVNTLCTIGAQGQGVSILTMAERTLGPAGARLASAAYIFLHYALLVAYISRAGQIVADATHAPLLPSAAGFTLAFAAACYLLPPRALDQVNGGLVAALSTTFLALMATTVPYVDVTALGEAHWAQVPRTLPVIALAFVYQNVVPVVTTNLESDPRKIRDAILLGTLLPLAMFVLWEGAILGSLGELKASALAAAAAASGNAATTAAAQAEAARAAADPLLALQESNASVGPLVAAFSFLAISTSFIGFILGLTAFLADALKLKEGSQQPLTYALAITPAFGLALAYPTVFLSALDVAGTYGALTLFGILPALMVWSLRYGSGTGIYSAATADSRASLRVQMLPGGKPALLAMGALSLLVISKQALSIITAAMGQQ